MARRCVQGFRFWSSKNHTQGLQMKLSCSPLKSMEFKVQRLPAGAASSPAQSQTHTVQHSSSETKLTLEMQMTQKKGGKLASDK